MIETLEASELGEIKNADCMNVGDRLEVVGGGGAGAAAPGGILVRVEKSTASAKYDERLSTGSIVRALACEGDRVNYELISGTGPATGWVSSRVGGKELLVKSAASSREREAASLYCKRLETAKAEEKSTDFIFVRNAFPWKSQNQICSSEAREAELVAELELCKKHGGAEPTKVEEEVTDCDGERVLICQHCSLPLGNFAYTHTRERGLKVLMHAECTAQVMSKDLRMADADRKRQEVTLKSQRRDEFDIGWKPELIPTNHNSADKLGSNIIPHGMCCLVLQEGGGVRVAPTFEPAANINLEYLSVALKVRRLEKHEPLFSLDPVDAKQLLTKAGDPEASMQTKRFEPEWLAGTMLGEVMFQADYHLKELSMGECDQPVVGMKSCFELSEGDGFGKEWQAREWFVVRHASIEVSEDKVLVPSLRMGVEAREQYVSQRGLEDAPLTRPDHPLVKYAAAFTKNFDLIAERKSVVCQLREVAKATIMAKYLLESGFQLDDSWFRLGEVSNPTCCLEVPQLWNDRSSATIRVQDGKIMHAEKGDAKMHCVYGGVNFGIDRFRLAGPGGRAALGRPASSLMATTQARLAGVGPVSKQYSRLSALSTGVGAGTGPLAGTGPASSLMATSRLSMAAPMAARGGFTSPFTQLSASRPASSLMAGTSRISMTTPSLMPQGVDLNLSQFNLSEASQGTWVGMLQAPEQAKDLVMGSDTFFSMLQPGQQGLGDQDRELFAGVFQRAMSDRHEDGQKFLPPPTGPAYLGRLRALVKAEESIRAQRKALFCSVGFNAEAPGPLFPSAWASSIEVAHNLNLQNSSALLLSNRDLRPRPDLMKQEAWLEEALASAEPIWEKCTEDKQTYSVYRFGSIEARCLAESDGKRTVVAVFSSGAARPNLSRAGAALSREEKIVKVSEYAEKSSTHPCHYFLVMHTEGRHVVVSEIDCKGQSQWVENPRGIEDRLSLAKVIRSSECGHRGLTVGAARSYRRGEDETTTGDHEARNKHLGRQLYSRLSGEEVKLLQCKLSIAPKAGY
mmetsp:Transcript_52237/g.113805  ORF Transcript_52237/g.113805 Transcript_52237/m.113805 type:complete len:1026 (+) Transcript_52237:80-3157(+)